MVALVIKGLWGVIYSFRKIPKENKRPQFKVPAVEEPDVGEPEPLTDEERKRKVNGLFSSGGKVCVCVCVCVCVSLSGAPHWYI